MPNSNKAIFEIELGSQSEAQVLVELGDTEEGSSTHPHWLITVSGMIIEQNEQGQLGHSSAKIRQIAKEKLFTEEVRM